MQENDFSNMSRAQSHKVHGRLWRHKQRCKVWEKWKHAVFNAANSQLTLKILGPYMIYKRLNIGGGKNKYKRKS